MKQELSNCFLDAFVRGVCNFLGSLSPQQKFEATDRPVLQLRVIAQFYLAGKGKYILEACGWADPKDTKRREALPQFLLLFLCFSPPPEPALCKLGCQEGCLFYLRSLFRSLDLPFFYFHGLFPSLSFSHSHFGLLFSILTT